MAWKTRFHCSNKEKWSLGYIQTSKNELTCWPLNYHLVGACGFELVNQNGSITGDTAPMDATGKVGFKLGLNSGGNWLKQPPSEPVPEVQRRIICISYVIYVDINRCNLKEALKTRWVLVKLTQPILVEKKCCSCWLCIPDPHRGSRLSDSLSWRVW